MVARAVYDVSFAGTCLHKLDAHDDAVTCLATFLGPKGAEAPVLFSGSRDCDAKIWDLTEMRLERTLAGHRDEVLCLAVGVLQSANC